MPRKNQTRRKVTEKSTKLKNQLEETEKILSANIIGTRNIFASSNHATGAYQGFEPDLNTFTQPELPKISPQDPIRPNSDYGVSKVFGEAVARYYSDRWGIKAICLRIGAVLETMTRQSNLKTERYGSVIGTRCSSWKRVFLPMSRLAFTMGFPTIRVPSGISPMPGQT